MNRKFFFLNKGPFYLYHIHTAPFTKYSSSPCRHMQHFWQHRQVSPLTFPAAQSPLIFWTTSLAVLQQKHLFLNVVPIIWRPPWFGPIMRTLGSDSLLLESCFYCRVSYKLKYSEAFVPEWSWWVSECILIGTFALLLAWKQGRLVLICDIKLRRYLCTIWALKWKTPIFYGTQKQDNLWKSSPWTGCCFLKGLASEPKTVFACGQKV